MENPIDADLFHALFFGIGAYTTALLNKHFGWPLWSTIPLGGMTAVLVGFIAGLPTLRLRGFYLSLVTLSFPIILGGFIFAFPDFTGGELGLYGIDGISDSKISEYYIVHLIMAVSLLVMWKFTDSGSKIIRVGVILHAIREDEITARASGINTTRYKLLAFATSGFFSGIAGGLYAHYLRVVGPSTIALQFSFEAVLWTIFGGIATIYGAIVGVYIIYPIVLEGLGIFELGAEIRFIVLSLILMCTILYMPEGISIWVLDKIEVKCPRCKLVNITTRRFCRACSAPLHLERKKTKELSVGEGQ